MAPAPPPQLPPYIAQLVSLYESYIHPLLPGPVQSLSSTVTPFLHSAISAAASGDIVSLAAFVVTVYLTVRIADYLRRSVIAWVVFLIKVALLLALVNAAFYVNQVGLQKALGDAEWIIGILWGLVEDKVMNNGERSNRTGAQREGPFGYYGGGRQQVPIAGRGGRKKASGWR